jgi:hypothetical protein
LKESNNHPQTPLDSFMKTTDSLRTWFFDFDLFQRTGFSGSLISKYLKTGATSSLRGFK